MLTNLLRRKKLLYILVLTSFIFFGYSLYKVYRWYPFWVASKPYVDETHCRYVSTLGLQKSCYNLPNCYYLLPEQLPDFVVPQHDFVLVTGYSDATIPLDYRGKAEEILGSKHLIKWYAQNLEYTNEKLFHLPIGLDYHLVIKNPRMKAGPVQSPVKQEAFIDNLSRKSFYEREHKIYCNFAHAIRGRYGFKDRADAISQVPHDLLVVEGNFVPRMQSWTNMVRYSFVLSPLGNGLDCHRTWEALVLGSIPIVKSGPLDPLYSNLPVLIVQEWSDITPELLEETINSFKDKKFDYSKLTLEHWSRNFSRP